MVLPPGPLVFPMKDSWNKANLSLEGKRASMLEPSSVSELFGCPPDHQKQQVGGGAGDGTDPAFGAGDGTDDAVA
eukprot:3088239-Heterocapsa_arctica.AAC.1